MGELMEIRKLEGRVSAERARFSARSARSRSGSRIGTGDRVPAAVANWGCKAVRSASSVPQTWPIVHGVFESLGELLHRNSSMIQFWIASGQDCSQRRNIVPLMRDVARSTS
jgi:hypothetical protein